MPNTLPFFHLPIQRYLLLPTLVLIILGPIIILAQSPLPATLFYLFVLLVIALMFRSNTLQQFSLTHSIFTFFIAAGLSLAFLYATDSLIKFSDISRQLPPNGLVDNTLYTWGHLITNNSYGFREREFATPKPTGTYRLMILGDSMSWGVGLPVTQRYSNVLEDLLNQNQSSTHFEVINFATQAARTADELATLKKYLTLVEPDQIIIGFNFDDMGSSDTVVDPERRYLSAQYDHLFAPYLSQLRLHYLSGQASKAINQAATLIGFIPNQTIELQRQLAAQEKNLPAFQQTLQQIKAVSDSLQLPPPIFVVLERGLYADRPTDYTHPNAALQAIINQQKIAESAAVTAGLITQHHRTQIAQSLNDQILSVNSVDHHPSAALHRLYATKLRTTVLANMAYVR